VKVRNIFVNVFEESKKDEKRRLENEQKILSNPVYKNILNPLDPYLDLEKNDIKETEEKEFQTFYEDIVDKINNLQLDDDYKKEQIIAQLKNKFHLRYSMEEVESLKNKVVEYLEYFNQQIDSLAESMNQNSALRQNVII